MPVLVALVLSLAVAEPSPCADNFDVCDDATADVVVPDQKLEAPAETDPLYFPTILGIAGAVIAIPGAALLTHAALDLRYLPGTGTALGRDVSFYSGMALVGVASACWATALSLIVFDAAAGTTRFPIAGE